MKNLNITKLPVSDEYPKGLVIVTNKDGTTEYTLDQWATLQKSQQ